MKDSNECTTMRFERKEVEELLWMRRKLQIAFVTRPTEENKSMQGWYAEYWDENMRNMGYSACENSTDQKLLKIAEATQDVKVSVWNMAKNGYEDRLIANQGQKVAISALL